MGFFHLIIVELKRVFRSRFSLFVTFLIPIALMIISIFLFNSFTEINMKIGVLNLDKDPLSRLTVGIVMSMFRGGTLSYVDQNYLQKLLSGELNAVVVIPEDFTKNLYSGKPTVIKFIPSPIDFQLSTVTYHVFNSMFKDLNGSPFFDPQVIRYLFTSPGYPAPQLDIAAKENLFSIPSVLAPVALFLTSALIVFVLSIQTVVRDKNFGLIEYYVSANFGSLKYSLAKVLAISMVGILVSCVALIFELILKVDVPLNLTLNLLLINSLVHASLGIMISALSNNENFASLIGICFVILIFLFSGIAVPVTSIPKALRIFALYNPLFLETGILRKAQMYNKPDFNGIFILTVEAIILILSAILVIKKQFVRR
ncbi:ABC transporter permease [Pseudothermotoga thermarum]|uniref:ABC-2 type transporter n=1 Tax=Pseudothermotoga thermarum DSM 5069 TaxID=688269 RepID=F7YYB0_9THEM|nr:ABC transporter permease [Pseudothermotoga thermarum]AEH50931.1 ABC-2 type transporter [Pseudothermotoga thermarum DSM 5069]